MPKYEDEMKVFIGSSHPELGQEIVKYLQAEPTKVKISHFACGEIYVRILENIRGRNAYIMQTSGPRVNEDYMELFIMIDALRRASAKSITVVIPHFGYARQDRKADSREPISSRLMADLLTAAGVNRIISMDLHSDQIQGFFNIPFDHLTALPLLTDYFKGKKLKDAVVVAPDAGRAKTSKKFADRIGAPLAIVHKQRPEHQKSEVFSVVGDVSGKTVIVVDDMVDTGGTIIQAVEALRKHGANPDCFVAATHGIFSPPATEKLKKAKIKEVVVTNSFPIAKEKQFPGLKVLSVAPLLAEAIKRAHENESVSSLFD